LPTLDPIFLHRSSQEFHTLQLFHHSKCFSSNHSSFRISRLRLKIFSSSSKLVWALDKDMLALPTHSSDHHLIPGRLSRGGTDNRMRGTYVTRIKEATDPTRMETIGIKTMTEILFLEMRETIEI